MTETDEDSNEGSVWTDHILRLEEIDVDLFRGTDLYLPIGGRSVYGGQVVGHALRAAYMTAPSNSDVHSIHCYYLRGGSPKRPLLYRVEHTREGKTYCNRSVKAVQEGAAIFTMQASFKKKETDMYRHQFTMPDVPPPENIKPERELMKMLISNSSTSELRKVYLRKRLTQELPYEFRPVDPAQYIKDQPLEPHYKTWMRALGNIGDSPALHNIVLAYLSDMMVDVIQAPFKFGGKDGRRFQFVTSLDHSVWFHNPFRIDEWMLFEKRSPHCGDGRGLSLARIWRRDGVLAASVAQEAVMRTSKANL